MPCNMNTFIAGSITTVQIIPDRIPGRRIVSIVHLQLETKLQGVSLVGFALIDTAAASLTCAIKPSSYSGL